MGDVVREEAARRGLRIDASTLARLSLELRQTAGWDVIAKMTAERLPSADVVVVEGVRCPAEVEFFRRHFSNVFVVAIHCSPKGRFQRLRSRQREDDPKSWDEFVDRDRREISLGIGEVIALADFMLVNEGVSKDEFIDLCMSTLKKIIAECFGCREAS